MWGFAGTQTQEPVPARLSTPCQLVSELFFSEHLYVLVTVMGAGDHEVSEALYMYDRQYLTISVSAACFCIVQRKTTSSGTAQANVRQVTIPFASLLAHQLYHRVLPPVSFLLQQIQTQDI